jgi:hypothetical protein
VAETIRMMLEESYAVTLLDEPEDMPDGPGPSLVITDLARHVGMTTLRPSARSTRCAPAPERRC